MRNEARPEFGLFTASQFDAAYPEGIERHWWTCARSRIIATILRESGIERGRILEIGCGRGASVIGLRNCGVDCSGVELADTSPLPAAQAYIRTGCDAHQLPASDRDSVTSILLLDVVEHVADPSTFVLDLRRSFPSLLRVIVTVPARQELWSNYDEYFGHHRRYDLDMLRALGDRLGWCTLHCSYAFRTLYLPARLLGVLGLRRSTSVSVPNSKTNFLHAWIATLLFADWRVFPDSWPGSSAVACYDCAPGRITVTPEIG